MSKVGDWLKKASRIGGKVAEIAIDVIPGGSQLKDVVSILKGEDTEEAKALLMEHDKFRLEFEKELYELEVKDRASARSREIEITKTGKFDIMHYLTGFVGLGAFGFIVYALSYLVIPDANRDLFIHLVGIIEGVVISIFGYYYGTSKSSSDKNRLMKKDY